MNKKDKIDLTTIQPTILTSHLLDKLNFTFRQIVKSSSWDRGYPFIQSGITGNLGKLDLFIFHRDETRYFYYCKNTFNFVSFFALLLSYNFHDLLKFHRKFKIFPNYCFGRCLIDIAYNVSFYLRVF